ncbi:unnamed protein product [Acanthoscelides obtectus]|uniref:Uncharacterized protein n=1 Tax=Acanthoscelides obtectus TaxID=200917 RepID=A0A9P0KDU0_ACAOB|nr:unnamed protein product [Acanthoscelides obtectus]CAK1648196.1 hypothetical protein AOBTE_LOCUS15597 [Acanthoscelides obtectus]
MKNHQQTYHIIPQVIFSKKLHEQDTTVFRSTTHLRSEETEQSIPDPVSKTLSCTCYSNTSSNHGK